MLTVNWRHDASLQHGRRHLEENGDIGSDVKQATLLQRVKDNHRRRE
jgi:hypothetical protein